MVAKAPPSTEHHVRFLFDPACPWAWRASLWIRTVARLRPVIIEWGLLSLEYLNQGRADNPFHELHLKSRLSMRLLAVAGQKAGNAGIEALYAALGDLHHGQGRDLDDRTVLTDALSRSSLSTLLLNDALSNPKLDVALQTDYERAWLGGAFGVPTIYIDHSEIPYFGPVIDRVPPEQQAGELWDHIHGISRHQYFFELKRERK
jgi:predicted DsbA family dithiol-disulfide isomerase